MALAFMLALTACTGSQPGPDQTPEPSPGAAAVAEQLAMALAAGTIEALPFAGDAERAVLDHAQTTGRLDLLPTVTVGTINYPDQTTAEVALHQRYRLEQGEWSFTSNATLRYLDSAWRIDWTPQIVHPRLSATTRLFHDRTPAKRGSILDTHGAAIVEDRPVYRVGIDKTKIDQTQWDASARALAALLGLDAEAYAAQVAASGPLAFVLAITLREGQVPPAIDQIPGATAYGTTLPLAPSPTFARGLLGTAGEATAEVIEASGGAIKAGDVVGLSGLQAYHDEQLRGTPGHTISIIDRNPDQLAELPPPTPTPTTPGASDSGAPTQTPAPGPTSTGPTDELLFSVAPINGTPLQLTMDIDLQRKAEAVLAEHGDHLAMVVVLDRNTGGLLAAANSPGAGAQFFVTTGQYPPGSTMKVVTALALLRRGYTPDSIVNCSETAEVNGRIFRNYPGYPAAFAGQITLRTALQQSCNTAFMNQAKDFTPEELASAAASLGIGVDYDTGFDAFYGSVPPTDDPVVMAADAIGQGQVLLSPMALAAEAASVSGGQTLVPYLVEGMRPQPDAQPLTATEAAQLADMMSSVVSGGTLPHLRGWLDGGKSGTAEYGADDPPKTHGWAVGYVGEWAICAMDYDQVGGTYLPQMIIQQMLS